ncbi:hypothetical protein NDU88_000729 [Pleurodeles waltl]|uniref:Uncharacterized protein n=1 Tax=Pleurodeles waltl TaxID=8319 RepID=A0AAV7L995_PLEWA|nr:hypothetical protein NDU88_000729 [Pleurodeles waltl]
MCSYSDLSHLRVTHGVLCRAGLWPWKLRSYRPVDTLYFPCLLRIGRRHFWKAPPDAEACPALLSILSQRETVQRSRCISYCEDRRLRLSLGGERLRGPFLPEDLVTAQETEPLYPVQPQPGADGELTPPQPARGPWCRNPHWPLLDGPREQVQRLALPSLVLHIPGLSRGPGAETCTAHLQPRTASFSPEVLVERLVLSSVALPTSSLVQQASACPEALVRRLALPPVALPSSSLVPQPSACPEALVKKVALLPAELPSSSLDC